MLPTSVLVVYPARVCLLVAVSVGQVSHELCGTWCAVVIYLPEHYTPVAPTAHAVLPQGIIQPRPLLIAPRQLSQPIDEERMVGAELHRATDIRPRYLQHGQGWGCWSWWRWGIVQRHVIHRLVVLLSQPTDSVGERQPFVRHEELNGSALRIADEAAVGVAAPLLRHVGWSHDEVAVVSVVVEWAEGREVHASLTEGHEVAHHVLNLGDVLDASDDVVGNLWHRSNVRVYLAASLYYTKPLWFAILNRRALLY